jgi:hypothetical protein
VYLREVELYDAAGAQLPRTTLKATFLLGAAFGGLASSCIDGSLGTQCIAERSNAQNKLDITYPCNTGSTSLSKVVVYNTLDTAHSSRIVSFQLEFRNASNGVDRDVFPFFGAQGSYTVPAYSGAGGHPTPPPFESKRKAGMLP